MKTYGINLQRAGADNTKPRGITAVGELVLKFCERGGVGLRVATRIKNVEQCRALMFCHRCDWQRLRPAAALGEKVEIIELFRLRQCLIQPDETRASVSAKAVSQWAVINLV
ncbi:MAG: hypothetical protein WC740_15500 [Verrucomicrobiia bacterium]